MMCLEDVIGWIIDRAYRSSASPTRYTLLELYEEIVSGDFDFHPDELALVTQEQMHHLGLARADKDGRLEFKYFEYDKHK